MKKKNNLFSVIFAIVLILLGLSIFIDIAFNFLIFVAILVFVYAIFNVLAKEYLKGLYLFIISIILLNSSSFINIDFLENISWSIAIIGVTLIYLGIKSLLD